MKQPWNARIDDGPGHDEVIRGAGFLVDDIHVLTCAHVVEEMTAPTVRFPNTLDQASMPVEVIYIGFDEYAKPLGDLAVLRLPAPIDLQPARFAPFSVLDWRAGWDLWSYGFPRGHPDGRVARHEVAGPLQVGNDWYELVSPGSAGTATSVVPGFSGSAVMYADGLVAGMVTDGTDDDRRIGLMLPTEVLCQYWKPLTKLVSPPHMSADSYQELRNLLARIRVERPAGVYARVLDGQIPPGRHPAQLSSLQAVAEYLLESTYVAEEAHRRLHDLLGIVSEQADAAVQDALHQWWESNMRGLPEVRARETSVVSRARRLEALPNPASNIADDCAVLIVEVDISAVGKGLYLLNIYPPEDSKRDNETYDGLSSEDVRRIVEDRIPRIREFVAPGREILIEFALPRTWLNKVGDSVDEWCVGTEITRPLSQEYSVVVRDVKRFQGRHERELRHRWRGLGYRSSRNRDLLAWADCSKHPDLRVFGSWLGEDETRGAVALTSAPSDSALTLAIEGGVPIMIWPRQRCSTTAPGCASRSCGVPGFLAQMSECVSGWADPRSLPQLVRALRNQAGQASDNEPHCGRSVTLLWDDPEHRPSLSLGDPTWM
jgi:hypothetical protein